MITLTAGAAKKMQDALYNRGRGIGMRIGVRTSGCSGFAYVLEFADKLFVTLMLFALAILPTTDKLFGNEKLPSKSKVAINAFASKLAPLVST